MDQDARLSRTFRAAARSATWLVLAAALALAAGCREELQGRLGENDANDMLDVLYGAGIAGRKVSTDGRTWSVEVESADLQRALRVARDNGLPRQRYASTGELFKKEGLVSTPTEERIRYLFAISQELSQTLAAIDGVLTARVHPVIPQNDPLADKVKPSSASVFIKHRRGANLEAMAPAIKNLVMRGIEGLSYDNISLIFVTAEEPPRAMAQAAPAMAAPVDRGLQIAVAVLAVCLAAALAVVAWLLQRARPGGLLRRRGKPGPRPLAVAASSNDAHFAAGP